MSLISNEGRKKPDFWPNFLGFAAMILVTGFLMHNRKNGLTTHNITPNSITYIGDIQP